MAEALEAGHEAGSSANLYWRAADGTGEVERLTESPIRHAAHSISPDGTRLVMYETAPNGTFDLFVVRLDEDRVFRRSVGVAVSLIGLGENFSNAIGLDNKADHA